MKLSIPSCNSLVAVAFFDNDDGACLCQRRCACCVLCCLTHLDLPAAHRLDRLCSQLVGSKLDECVALLRHSNLKKEKRRAGGDTGGVTQYIEREVGGVRVR